MEKISLFQYGPLGFKTPSCCPDCLHVQALLKFGGRQVRVVDWNDSNRSNTKKLPVMVVGEGEGGVVASGARECVRNLRGVMPHMFGDNRFAKGKGKGKKGKGERGKGKGKREKGKRTTKKTDTRSSSDHAFCALADRLNLILKFNWFEEKENYEWLKSEVFHDEFSAFPFKYYNSHLKKTEMDNLFKLEDLIDEKDVYKEADDGYFLLADRLGNRTYFGGNDPNHLDAAVFSHLAVALFSPLPKRQLSAAIQKKPELVNYVVNILQKYWGLSPSVPSVGPENDQELPPNGKIWKEVGIPLFLAFSFFSVYIVGSNIPARIHHMLSEN